MSVRIYKDGEHPAGFVGVRVVRTIGSQRDYRQKYFNFRDPDNRKAFVSLEQEQKIIAEARALDEKWAKAAEKKRLTKSLTCNHANATNASGLGFEGITLGIHTKIKQRVLKRDGRRVTYENYQVFFCVNLCRPAKRFPISELNTYSNAWRAAVNGWADLKGVSQKIRQEKLNNPPHPDRFKALRRYLNRRGHNVPPSVLRWVYAEQRRALKNQIIY